MNRCRHKAIKELGPYPMDGACECPGCNNAFSYYIDVCSCGAERTVCSGMGTASLPVHRAHGYSIWHYPDSSDEDE